MVKNISKLRKDYQANSDGLNGMHSNPIAQFKKWFGDAIKNDILEPNAMTLATVNADGIPSARMVLLKDVTEEGFIFYTNYNSRKGQELLQNPAAALVFWWGVLERQVRIQGKVQKVASEVSDAYFASRPKGSQIAAAVSPQSKIIKKDDLREQWKKMERTYQEKIVLRPTNWGGYILKPKVIEFWHGRPNRLHDRIQYTLHSNDVWKREQLAP